MAVTDEKIGRVPRTELSVRSGAGTITPLARVSKAIWWGVAVGVIQAVSPLGFWWLNQGLVWALALVIIAPVYVGFAVADGRTRVVAIEVCVASGFVILAAVAISWSPWLVVIGLVAHGGKDLWQERTQFVTNTRWWPSFCLVVDFVAAAIIATFLLVGIHLDR